MQKRKANGSKIENYGLGQIAGPIMRPSNYMGAVSKIELSGGFLPDGRPVDFVVDESTGKLKLVILDSNEFKTLGSIQVANQIFVPPVLDSKMQGAITFPTKPLDYESTKSLFDAACAALTKYGIPKEVATTAIYTTLASWFTERSLPMPCLVITGPSAEAHLLLQLLACMVHRGLPTFEIDSRGFCDMANIVDPTILMDARYLTPRGRRLLSASCRPGAFLLRNGSVSEFSFAKIIYIGPESMADFSADCSLRVHLLPSLVGVPVLSEKERQRITAEFQSRFLAYRLRNAEKICASSLDFSGFDSESRIIGQMLGRCIQDAPDIQAGVRVLLREREDRLRADRWTDLTCVVIEVLWALSHKKPLGKTYVKDVAEAAEVAFKCRGEVRKLEPREIGVVLDALGLIRKRDQRGYRIRLTSTIQGKIHTWARNHQVESARQPAVGCTHCAEVLSGAVGIESEG